VSENVRSQLAMSLAKAQARGETFDEAFAAVESATRADEAAKVRAKVIDECAKAAKSFDNGRYVYGYEGQTLPSRSGQKIAAAIRALGEKDNG